MRWVRISTTCSTTLIPAQIEQPRVTADELKGVLFRDVLGQCRTHVSGSSARISNVKLSAAACNGVVLNTGDVFSYNNTTGQRTTAKGYQAAPAYVGGETVDEVGGGVCQTSSTLYYACLRANLEITERYAHRYVPAYIDWGMDATVSWGGPDYKFTNNTDYPIKIVTSYSGGYLTVKILGTNVDGTYVKMTNEVLSKTNWETVYKDDPSLPAGTEKVTTTPYTGYKVKSYRNVYSASGKLISSTYEATSDYKVRNKVITRGPALPAQPETPVTGPADERSADLEGQRIPTYEDVLSLDTADIAAAGYEERGGLACVWAQTAPDALGYVETYWVAVDSGLLVSAETTLDGTLTYRMTAYGMERPAPAGTAFALPDGTVLHTAGE